MRTLALPIALLCMFLTLLAGCSKPPAETAESADTSKFADLASIPAPDPSKFPKIEDMSDWRNPYFVVREDGIGLVDMSNHEVHILRPEEIPAELVSLPSSAWPYGRIVLIAEAKPKIPSEQAKSDIRKNRGLLTGTLKELDVQIREVP